MVQGWEAYARARDRIEDLFFGETKIIFPLDDK